VPRLPAVPPGAHHPAFVVSVDLRSYHLSGVAKGEASWHFAGPPFPDADAYIFDVARNSAPSAGNATTWRQLNTTHHITQVVADIAKVRKIRISRLPDAPVGMQQTLLDA